MNWQTKEVDKWLDEVGILNSQREDIQKLQELVESYLLVQGKGQGIHCVDYLKNLAVTELLAKVEWEELVINPNAWSLGYYDSKEDVT